MPNYRRAKTEGGTFFFTVVTYRRQETLTLPESRLTLRNIIIDTKRDHPFKILAWVLLPDHMHCIWTLPEGDSDFSKRWGLIKAKFSKHIGEQLHRDGWVDESKTNHRERTIWQRRFWEHQIRNEKDFERHMDYIHYNPVKHGNAKRVCDWPYSPFHRFVRLGVYPMDWADSTSNTDNEEYGE